MWPTRQWSCHFHVLLVLEPPHAARGSHVGGTRRSCTRILPHTRWGLICPPPWRPAMGFSGRQVGEAGLEPDCVTSDPHSSRTVPAERCARSFGAAGAATSRHPAEASASRGDLAVVEINFLHACFHGKRRPAVPVWDTLPLQLFRGPAGAGSRGPRGPDLTTETWQREGGLRSVCTMSPSTRHSPCPTAALGLEVLPPGVSVCYPAVKIAAQGRRQPREPPFQ